MRNYYIEYTINGVSMARARNARGEEAAIAQIQRQFPDATNVRAVSKKHAMSLSGNTVRHAVQTAIKKEQVQ